MKVGICSWAFAGSFRGNRPVAEMTSLAEGTGFSSLEGAYHPRGCLGTAPPPTGNLLRVPIGSLATLQLNRLHLTSPHPEVQARALEVVRGMLECAASWGIPSVSISLGPLYPGYELEAVLQQLAGQLMPLIESTLLSGCRIALENVPRHCLATRKAMALALTHLGPPLGVCVDTGNALLDPPVSQWLEEFGTRIVKLHLSDGHVDDFSFIPTLPGRGQVPWGEVREGVERIGCRPDLFVEAPLPAGASEVIFLQEVRRAVQAVWE